MFRNFNCVVVVIVGMCCDSGRVFRDSRGFYHAGVPMGARYRTYGKRNKQKINLQISFFQKPLYTINII